MNTYGKQIRSWREAEGLTRTALAKLLSVSAQTIYYWETGAKRPSLSHCRALQRISKRKLKQEQLAFD